MPIGAPDTVPSGATARLWGYIPTSQLRHPVSPVTIASRIGCPSTSQIRPSASRSIARGLALGTTGI